MVRSGCHAVGMVTSLFRRCYNRRRGYEPIPPCEAEEKGESGKAQMELCDGEGEEDDEDGCKKELYEEAAVWKKIKEEGESDEACGDRLLDRSRSGGGTSFAAYKDLHYAAFFYAQAGNWRNAALAYGELAAYCRKVWLLYFAAVQPYCCIHSSIGNCCIQKPEVTQECKNTTLLGGFVFLEKHQHSKVCNHVFHQAGPE